MSAVPPKAFADRPDSVESGVVRISRPVASRKGAFGVFRHAQVLRLRRAALTLAMSRPRVLPSTDRTVSAHGSSDFGARWLAYLYLLPMLHPPRYRDWRTGTGDLVGPRRLARSFSSDSFIPDSKPVYPGAYPVPVCPFGHVCPLACLFKWLRFPHPILQQTQPIVPDSMFVSPRYHAETVRYPVGTKL